MIQMSVTDGKERRAFEEAESMHSYYSEKKEKIKKGMNEFFILVSAELEDMNAPVKPNVQMIVSIPTASFVRLIMSFAAGTK